MKVMMFLLRLRVREGILSELFGAVIFTAVVHAHE